MVEFFKWIIHAGRLSGAIGLVLGILILAACYADLQKKGSYFPVLMVIGAVLVILGVVKLIFGEPKNKKRKTENKSISVERLKMELAKHSFPYTLCLLNRKVVPKVEDDVVTPQWRANECVSCNPELDHMEICDEEDLKLALAGMED